MTVSSDQPKRNAGSGPEALQEVGEHSARPGERRRQLGQGQGAEEGDGAADDPGHDDRPWLLEALGDAGGNPEDAAADGGADENRDGAPEPEVPGKALTPGVGAGCEWHG